MEEVVAEVVVDVRMTIGMAVVTDAEAVNVAVNVVAAGTAMAVVREEGGGTIAVKGIAVGSRGKAEAEALGMMSSGEEISHGKETSRVGVATLGKRINKTSNGGVKELKRLQAAGNG